MTNSTVTRTLSSLCVLTLTLTLAASTASVARVHKIKSGDSLWTIAKKYNTTPEKLAKANHLTAKSVLKLDRQLRIPGGDAPKLNKSRKSHKSETCTAGTHRIKEGESLWTIAKKYKTTPEKLAKANHLTGNSILKLDRELRIPGLAAAKSHKHALVSKKLTHAQKMLAKAKAAKLHAKHLAALKAAKANKLAKLHHGSKSGKFAKLQRPSKAKVAKVAGKGQMKVVRTAMAYQGARYRSGGTSRGGFDCSGFTRYIYSKYGVSLPHSSAAQAHVGRPVSRKQLKPGDIVYFHTYRRGVSHVGIYAGNNQFVHASTYGRGVRVDSLSSSYYASRYMGARRVK